MTKSLEEILNPPEIDKIITLHHVVTEQPVPLVTLEAKLKEQLPPNLTPVLNPAAFAALYEDLDYLPEKIQEAGKAVDEALKSLQQAQGDLKVAEANALAFPDRELKNDAARKAYLVEKTQQEAARVQAKQDAKIDADRELSDVMMQLRATEYKVDLTTSLLKFLTR